MACSLLLSVAPAGQAITTNQLFFLEVRLDLLMGLQMRGLQQAAAPGPSPMTATPCSLAVQAWRAVDRAYVDKSFNGQSWFRVREQYLKSEPLDSREQAYAAVVKLLKSLDDPFTRFLTPDRLAALRRGTAGEAAPGS